MVRQALSFARTQTLVPSYEKRPMALTFPSGKLPKLTLVLLPCRLTGGLPPPLAGGCGIGEGEVCGDVTRGLAGTSTASEFERLFGAGTAFAMVGDCSGNAPKWISRPPFDFPATRPPLIYPEAPAALIVTEGFRLWSPTPEVELAGVLPLTSAPTAGVAGGIVGLPFTGELLSSLPCCEVAAAIDEAVLPEAGGGEKVFFVALA